MKNQSLYSKLACVCADTQKSKHFLRLTLKSDTEIARRRTTNVDRGMRRNDSLIVLKKAQGEKIAPYIFKINNYNTISINFKNKIVDNIC